MDWKDQLSELRSKVSSAEQALQVAADERLGMLFSEIDQIYKAFPALRPREPKRTKTHCYTRRGLHWTQKPENAEKVAESLQRMQNGLRTSLEARKTAA